MCVYSLRVKKQTTLLPWAHTIVGVNCFPSLCIMFLIRTIMEDELCGLLNWLFVLIANRGLCTGLCSLTCFFETSLYAKGDPTPLRMSHIEKHPRGCAFTLSPHLSLKTSFQDTWTDNDGFLVCHFTPVRPLCYDVISFVLWLLLILCKT